MILRIFDEAYSMTSNPAKDNFGHVNSAKGLKDSLGQSCFWFPQWTYETEAYCSFFYSHILKELRKTFQWKFLENQMKNKVTDELQHDKTNKMAVHPAKTDQPGHAPSLISLCCPHEESLGP